MTTKDQLQAHDIMLASIDLRLDRVTDKLDRLTNTVIAHDAQIEQLIEISERNAKNWDRLERQWQAYLNTLPKH